MSSLFTTIHAGQLVANKTALVTATLSDTVENVLGKLLVHNIISLPLLNEVRRSILRASFTETSATVISTSRHLRLLKLFILFFSFLKLFQGISKF